MANKREQTLRIQLEKIAEEQGYGLPEIKIEAVPVTGSNFTSELFHATISSAGKDDLRLFAKVAVLGEDHRKYIPFKVFDIERFVYGKLLNTYKTIEEKHNVPEEHRLVTPKFYGYSDTYLEEVIVLEDLSVGGYTTYDRFTSIDWDYAAASVEEMAKLHGLSIAFQRELPEDYEEAKRLLKVESIDVSGELNQQMIVGMKQRSIQMIREENGPRVQKLLDQKFDPTNFISTTKEKRAVIIHGDFKQANLMHKTDENGKLRVIMIDYQTLRPSSAAGDLLCFTFNCADADFRQKHFDQLLDHYYEHMTDVLWRLHLDPEEVYPRDDFDEEVKDSVPFALIHSVITLPIFYMEQKDVKPIDPDSKLESMVTMIANPSRLCAQRLDELVEGCVRWGAI